MGWEVDPSIIDPAMGGFLAYIINKLKEFVLESLVLKIEAGLMNIKKLWGKSVLNLR